MENEDQLVSECLTQFLVQCVEASITVRVVRVNVVVGDVGSTTPSGVQQNGCQE